MIAASIATNDLLYIRFNVNIFSPLFSAGGDKQGHEPYIIGFGLARGSPELADRHLFSLYHMEFVALCDFK